MNSIPETSSRAAYFSLMTCADRLGGEFAKLFREHGITATVFNAMRILIQKPNGGRRIGEIGQEMIQRVPDITRLIDRMERDGFVRRQRSAEDRRAVKITLTASGRRKCESLYTAVADMHQSQLAHMSERELQQLNRLLRKAMAP
jgi:DNA-binding MarR family transcriptional regulator